MVDTLTAQQFISKLEKQTGKRWRAKVTYEHRARFEGETRVRKYYAWAAGSECYLKEVNGIVVESDVRVSRVAGVSCR